MYIIKYKTFFISLSVALVAISLILISTYGIKRGVDFTGGSVIDISYGSSIALLDPVNFEEVGIDLYETSNNTYRLITAMPYEEVSGTIETLANPNGDTPFEYTQISAVGPTMGQEMTRKAIIALVVVIFAILAFIAFSFREVSNPLSSWKYGVIAMVTLIHDILVPTGVYVLLSQKYGAEVDTLFVIALLTIIGISISDKIVVFDRIRENLKISNKKPFDEVVGESLKQTFTRSINTSVTVILAMLALYFFGPDMTKYFTLTLILGMIVGTYSSIFVASPLLTVWNRKK